ncbi:MAG: tyrosine-type recombinase/integrase [archaeon]
MEYVSLADMRRLELGISEERDRLLLNVLFETGCTVEEALSLTSRNIAAKAIRIGTTNRAISDALYAALKKQQGRFFSSARGTLSQRRVQQLIAQYGKTILCRKLTPHMFRTGYIINQFLHNTPLHTIEQTLGIHSVQHYIYGYFHGRTP